MLPPNLYARVHFCLRKWHARPRVRRAPGLPCALYFERAGSYPANLGRIAPRDREVISIRHCERSEAIHCHLVHRKMDCFAALAMTWRELATLVSLTLRRPRSGRLEGRGPRAYHPNRPHPPADGRTDPQCPAP